jgi:hypothetical protein
MFRSGSRSGRPFGSRARGRARRASPPVDVFRCFEELVLNELCRPDLTTRVLGVSPRFRDICPIRVSD